MSIKFELVVHEGKQTVGRGEFKKIVVSIAFSFLFEWLIRLVNVLIFLNKHFYPLAKIKKKINALHSTIFLHIFCHNRWKMNMY